MGGKTKNGNKIPKRSALMMISAITVVTMMMLIPLKKDDHQVRRIDVGLEFPNDMTEFTESYLSQEALDEVIQEWNYETTSSDPKVEQTPTGQPAVFHDIDATVELGDKCFRIRNYDCRNCDWVCDNCPNKIRNGGRITLRFRFVPSRENDKGVRIQHCEDKHKYIAVNWDTGNIKMSPVGNIFYIRRQTNDPLLGEAAYAIIPAENTQMAVSAKGGMFIEVHNLTTLSGLDGLWTFVDGIQKYPDFVHSFTTVPDRTAVKKFPPGCFSQHKGCCSPQRFEPKLNDPVTDSKPVVAALLTSSRNTLSNRMRFIKRWLFAPGDYQAVVTTDCFMPSMVSVLKEFGVYAWLVGPVGTAVKGFSEVSVRVPLSIHWMMRNMDPDWFFVVDDDTLVFTHNLFWGLSAFPNPRTVHYLVGHTSEWYQKTSYHGDMPYGGGGVLISSAFKPLWLRKWGKIDNPSSSWIQSGEWNHYGGDGALCRLLAWIMREEFGEDKAYFAEIRGFHQMDLVTSDKILQTVRRTCPRCPAVFDQIGHWFDDVISSQPVFTLHHLGAARLGSIFPGEKGELSMNNLQTSYYLHHPQVFLRRVCGSLHTKKMTLCINFGRSIQFYSETLSPEQGISVLRKTSFGNTNEQEKVINMALDKSALSAHIATIYWIYVKSEGSSKELQLYQASELEPAPTPSNTGIVVSATVKVVLEGTPKATVDIKFNDTTTEIFEIDISHLLKPKIHLTKVIN